MKNNYENEIKNHYNELQKQYEKNDIIQDSSEGGSYVYGDNFKTATFQPGQVTDKTTFEEDSRYFGQIRTAEKGNIKQNNNNNINWIPLLFTICIVITTIIILLPFMVKKKAD